MPQNWEYAVLSAHAYHSHSVAYDWSQNNCSPSLALATMRSIYGLSAPAF